MLFYFQGLESLQQPFAAIATKSKRTESAVILCCELHICSSRLDAVQVKLARESGKEAGMPTMDEYRQAREELVEMGHLKKCWEFDARTNTMCWRYFYVPLKDRSPRREMDGRKDDFSIN